MKDAIEVDGEWQGLVGETEWIETDYRRRQEDLAR